ncbi:MAG: Single-stranded-DNA-specific exonuclease RecJ [Microgenomates bacterium OLB22]|nr:MAG: Single-stranded-DNA-specific exonuclease RecJ [Microgenomates bacterium OLB22]
MKKSITKQARRTITTAISPYDILEMLLHDRGIEDLSTYLQPPHPDSIEEALWNTEHDQGSLNSFFELLKKVRESKGTIVIYGDYDADGITSTTILWKAFNEMGFRVFPYIPNRKTEGYGFSHKGIDHVCEVYSPALVLAVDHGIVAKEHVSYFREKRIPVVIIDHHQKDPDNYPDNALYLFYSTEYSAAALSYLAARRIYAYLRDSGQLTPMQAVLVKKLLSADLLALAALGLVADVIPLIGGARSVAYHGLKAFSRISMPGLKTLCAISGVVRKELRSYEVGYYLAPRLNAFGRIGEALDGVRLLCSPNSHMAERFGAMAQDLNKKRQILVESAMKSIEETVHESASFIVALGEEWEEGILGLIAGKLVSAYGKPAIALTKGEKGYKASGRSAPGFAMTKFLRSLPVSFASIGGHDGACGLTISIDEYPRLLETLSQSEIVINPPKVSADLDIPFSHITHSLFEVLQKMAPFGAGNPDPLFFSQSTLHAIKSFGKTSQHLIYSFRDGYNDFLDIIHFNAQASPLRSKNGESCGVFFYGG